eukprot:CAMPEP_0175294626 /NCGR_PEP_ID=MMETSP0093-20121207/58094_1 /TAXON_ID=311494 /ORGANISM="Alexandrium monilatum, Strain CCMP3105" /LENGTH=51 /DNA_ID=CAMNT_0016590565 /DNA_START=449 /DNA_END=604 /DNA_ORIENTATION=-
MHTLWQTQGSPLYTASPVPQLAFQTTLSLAARRRKTCQPTNAGAPSRSGGE